MTTGTIYEAPRAAPLARETIVTSTCAHNCGGRCVVNAHVRDDRIVRISTDARRWQPEHPPLPACARGIGQIERTYHPDRLQYPQRRVGPRGSGQYTRISWDEALDEIAREMRRVRAVYGIAAILDASRTGTQSMLHGRVAAQRFLYMFGGCTDLWSNMSAEAEVFAVRVTYGDKIDYKAAGREPTDYVNSGLILMWGWSPGDGTFGTGTMPYLKAAKRQGTRIVCVDPRRTMTSRQLADEHIFIRPSTDAAALIAMAYVIVSEGLHDQEFLRPPRARIRRAAPAGGCTEGCIISFVSAGTVGRRGEDAGMGRGDHRHPGRNAAPSGDGICHHKAGGIAGRLCARPHGAWRAVPSCRVRARGDHRQCRDSGWQFRCKQRCDRPCGDPKPAHRRRIRSMRASLRRCLRICSRAARAGGYPADIKLIYSSGGDLFNQCPNINKMLASLDGVEFFVAQDHFMTPTARLADIVLPATTFWERNDVHTPWAGAGHYAIFMRQAIQPMYECRNDIDIFGDLAARLGIAGYNDRSELDWLRELTGDAVDDFPRFMEQGVARFPPPRDAVAFAREIRDPERHRFSTPSGKIEIYSMALAAKPDPYGLGRIPPIPTWMPQPSLPAEYPLSLCTPKSRARTHSIHGNQPGLARVDPDNVWLDAIDAAARGIADGQRVRVFNARGATVLPAKVTDRIAPGVVSIKEGAWFIPDADGVDTQGCANVLTDDRSAPCGATTYNSNSVQVEAVR